MRVQDHNLEHGTPIRLGGSRKTILWSPMFVVEREPGIMESW